MSRALKLILCLLLISQGAQAGDMDACYQANFRQVDRVADLPSEVIGLIYANSQGELDLNFLSQNEQEKVKAGKYYLGIADRGGAFQPGCTDDGKTPMARVVMAAVSPACTLIAIEHGGAGHGAGLRIFLRGNETWVRGDKFDHPRAQLMYQGKYETDFPTFIAQANFEIGYLYEHGFGNAVIKDPAESIKWYSLAANQGHAHSMYTLGRMYSEGRGTPIDLTTALQWFEKAAQKNVRYQYELGAIYFRSNITSPDIKKGVKLIRAAADAGDSRAQVHLGQLYLEGDHLRQDYAKALKLFRDNMTGTDSNARYYLGMMYKNGLGVKKNLKVAWALLAGSGRNPQVIDFVQLFSRDDWEDAKNLKLKMDGGYTPEQKYVKPFGVLIALDTYLDSQQ